MKLLITGGTGFVGSALVRWLAQEGRHDVTMAVRSPRPAEKIRQVRVGEISGETAWHEAVAGQDVVVHLAARAHIMRDAAPDPALAYRRINTDATLELARQAAAAGVRRFVFMSSIKVNGEEGVFAETDQPAPQDDYGRSKHEAEQGLREIALHSGMAVTIIRPPLVYGPGVKAHFRALMRAVELGIPLPLGLVKNRRSLVAVDNLVDFILTCLEHPAAANEVFFVSDGEDLSTPDLVRRIARAMGRSARLVNIPPVFLNGVGTFSGRRAALQRLQGTLCVDIHKARSRLGWRPPWSLDQVLRKAVTTNQSFRLRPISLKRFTDITLALAVGLLLLGPLVLVALLIKVTSRGPVLYWSDRVGRNNLLFRMPKFRSMRLGTPVVATHLLQSPDRHLTTIGSLLRRSSLDELPQLWSIIKGDMSFVGPRPALFNQIDLIELRNHCGVHELVPGLTGWAQINGRDELSIPAKVALDLEYSQRKSFVLDLQILWRTLFKVTKGDGVTH